MALGARTALKGTMAADKSRAMTRGGQSIWPKDNPEARKAVISLSSDKRPKVRRQASSMDMGMVRVSTVGRKSRNILAETPRDTPLLTRRSTRSKTRSSRRTPEKRASPKRKGGKNCFSRYRARIIAPLYKFFPFGGSIDRAGGAG